MTEWVVEALFGALDVGRGRFIMVGDNIEADIGGAKALGIETVYVHRGENPLADHCFDTLMPIADLI